MSALRGAHNRREQHSVGSEHETALASESYAAFDSAERGRRRHSVTTESAAAFHIHERNTETHTRTQWRIKRQRDPKRKRNN